MYTPVISRTGASAGQKISLSKLTYYDKLSVKVLGFSVTGLGNNYLAMPDCPMRLLTVSVGM